jgi:hypothetical protein
MNATTLQQAIHSAPFRPFELVLADGSRVEVRHPAFIAFAGGRVAAVTDPDDRVNYIDVMLVTKLELAPPLQAGSVPSNPDGGE